MTDFNDVRSLLSENGSDNFQLILKLVKSHKDSSDTEYYDGMMDLFLRECPSHRKDAYKISQYYEDSDRLLMKYADLAAYKDVYGSPEEILEGRIQSIEKKGRQNQYYFNEAIEEFLISFFEEDEKYALTEENIPELYRAYAGHLRQADKIEAWGQALQKAREWNPMDFETIFELLDYYRHTDNSKAYRRLCIEACQKAFTSEILSDTYEHLGMWYFKDNRFQEALAIWVYAEHFTGETVDRSGLPDDLAEPDARTIIEIFEKENIPFAPSRTVMESLRELFAYFETEEPETACYILEYWYDLTGIEDVVERRRELIEKYDLDLEDEFEVE